MKYTAEPALFIAATLFCGSVLTQLSAAPGDGALWAMGLNSSGQLGDGTTTDRLSPVQILSGGVQSVAAGRAFSLIVKMDGSLWAMGDNSHGQLGDGTTTNRASPVQVVLPVKVQSVAAGDYFSLIVGTDGSLWAMGDNSYGELGDGTTTQRDNPVPVLPDGVQAVAAGAYFSVILKTDGSLWTMGSNKFDELGDGGTDLSHSAPGLIISGGVQLVSAGGDTCIIVKSDGSMWAMGDDSTGQFGDGRYGSRPGLGPISTIPLQIFATGIQAVSEGNGSSLIVKTDGSLWVTVAGNDISTVPGYPMAQVFSGGVATFAMSLFSLIVKTDGGLWAMGINKYGQLGDGTTNESAAPELVAGKVQKIAVGASHSLVVSSSGFAFVPGFNNQPVSQVAIVGGTATFSATAVGTPAPTYQWQVSKDAGGTWTSLTDTAPYSGTTTGTIAITGATIAMNGYQYRCVATNVLRGATSDAAVLTVSKMAATVTLVGSLSATYDGNAHSAAAITSPAGLTVDFTYRGSAAAPVNAGSYAVVATISDPDYQGSASGILAIAKASLIATADDENRAQGMANPTLTITYTGFVNGETAAVLDTPPTASTTATANSPVGSYPIILSGGSDKNYVLMLQNGTLTVTFTPTANAGQGVISKGFTASWNSVSGVTGYKLDVSTSSAFSSFVGGYQNFDVGNSTSEVIAGLGSNTTYYYRVRAYNSDGTGPASNIVTVTTAAPAVVMTPLAFSTLAGQALCSGSADGVGSAARFDYPSAVAADNAGNLYVADTDNHTVRKIVISTGAVTTLAGAAGSPGNADGTGPAAHFNNPSGVAVDGAGNVYIADTLNHTLRKVTSAGVVSTLAGLSGSAGFADGAGSAARFSGPQGLAIDGSGRLYVADTNNDSIRQVEISTGSVTTIPCRPFTLAVAAYCRNKAPTGVAVVGTGNIYVADPYDQRINGINPSGFFFVLAGEVTFYAAPAGADDGAGAVASFNSPSAIAEDLSGNLYVADTDNHTIRRIVTTGYSGDTFANWDDGVVTTSAGVAGTSGSADGLGSAARFFGPAGIAVDNNGDVFVADTNNHTIREFLQGTAPVIQTQPQSQTVTTGSSVQFFVTASGSPAATYQWNLNGAAISGATGGTYSLSSAQSGNAGNYTVVVSNVIGSVTSSAATLTVNVTSGGGGSGGSSSGGGGGGGAPSTWFCGALLLIAAIRTLQQRRERQKAWGFHVS